MKTGRDELQRAAAEVIELGEMLFDTAIDAMEHRQVEDGPNEAALIEEIRVAANEFFTALRLLLETEQETGKQNP